MWYLYCSFSEESVIQHNLLIVGEKTASYREWAEKSRYHIFRYAWNSYLNVDINYQKIFSCHTCKETPSIIILDGIQWELPKSYPFKEITQISLKFFLLYLWKRESIFQTHKLVIHYKNLLIQVLTTWNSLMYWTLFNKNLQVNSFTVLNYWNFRAWNINWTFHVIRLPTTSPVRLWNHLLNKVSCTSPSPWWTDNVQSLGCIF